MRTDQPVHIIGTGIGGLTTALALKRAGFNPVLFEQSSQLGEVGAGISLGPNASRVLSHLGLDDRMREFVWQPRHTGVMNYKTGEAIAYNLRGESYLRDFGAPFWHIHRADLLQCLADELDLGHSTKVFFDHRLVATEQDERGVVCSFESGETAESEVLIACDGLKSVVREQWFDTHPAQFTGYVAWRGLVDRSQLTGLKIDPDFALYAGQGRMFARYAVRRRSLINLVAISKRTGWHEEGWAIPASVEELLAEFEGWHESVVDLIAAIPRDECKKWALHIRRPLGQWIQGRIALLGDAAHPMTPFFGLGAAMGIEDALVLARCARQAGDWTEALAIYQATRLERGNHVQAASSKQGLYLLSLQPGVPMDRSLMGEDALGLYGYDAVNVELEKGK